MVAFLHKLTLANAKRWKKKSKRVREKKRNTRQVEQFSSLWYQIYLCLLSVDNEPKGLVTSVNSWCSFSYLSFFFVFIVSISRVRNRNIGETKVAYQEEVKRGQGNVGEAR